LRWEIAEVGCDAIERTDEVGDAGMVATEDNGEPFFVVLSRCAERADAELAGSGLDKPKALALTLCRGDESMLATTHAFERDEHGLCELLFHVFSE
jgi:hypothetical protein